jgi:hypothetical protein
METPSVIELGTRKGERGVMKQIALTMMQMFGWTAV